MSNSVGVYRKLDKYPQSKDDALEALDFIVNVLKEHEKNLDKLINELATVTEQIGDTGELSGKVEKVEVKLDTLQKAVTNLVGKLSGISKEALPAPVPKEQQNEVAADTVHIGPSAVSYTHLRAHETDS